MANSLESLVLIEHAMQRLKTINFELQGIFLPLLLLYKHRLQAKAAAKGRPTCPTATL